MAVHGPRKGQGYYTQSEEVVYDLKEEKRREEVAPVFNLLSKEGQQKEKEK